MRIMEKEKLVDTLKEGHSVNKKGYFCSYRENIFGGQMSEKIQDMFDEGSGGELHSKAEAVHSSSMLSYNFFHWIDNDHPFVWDGIKYTQVFFEVKMKTIKRSPAPANMDVVLIGEKERKKQILFIESKFTEYTETKKYELSDNYTKKDKWYYKDIEWEDKWVEILNNIKKEISSKKYKYKEGVKQLITHLFGIHSQFVDPCDRFENIDFKSVNLKFITLIFEPSKDRFEDEHNAYDNYKKLFDDFSANIKDVGLRVVPEWKSYGEIWEIMRKQIPEDLKNYLWERYMKFAELIT